MSKNDLTIIPMGSQIELQRSQWKGRAAKISNFPGLIEEIKKYTWTYTGGKHPYLKSEKLKISLHKFVLEFLYGKEKLSSILDKNNIIEHLDNDGLNCSYENLHIISEDWNKGKAFIIDKEQNLSLGIPAYTIDVFYLHNESLFQMQLFLNENMYYNKKTSRAIEIFCLKYKNFSDLYIDWIYVLQQRKKRIFILEKFHANYIYYKERPFIELKPDEENHTIIERNGTYYFKLNTEEQNKFAYLEKTALRIFE